MSSGTNGAQRIGTGVAGLDDIILGGWPINHLYLMEGHPGAGKTTLALQFLREGAKNGEKVLYVTLSESKSELEAVAASHQWPLDDVEIFEFVPSEESLRPDNEYSALHPSEVEFQDTMQAILQKIEDVRPSRAVIDSLSEIRLLARESLRYRRQVLALKHFFHKRSCTVLMLDDRTSEGRDMHLHSIAHGVLMLERVAREYGVERRRLRVSKLRGSVFREGFHDYTIKTGGLMVFPRLVARDHRQPSGARGGEERTAGHGCAMGRRSLLGFQHADHGPGGIGQVLDRGPVCVRRGGARRGFRPLPLR